jgi:hypothetical protein
LITEKRRLYLLERENQHDLVMTLKEITQQLENLEKILVLINRERSDFEYRIGKRRTEELIDRTLDRILYLKKMKQKLDDNDTRQ